MSAKVFALMLLLACASARVVVFELDPEDAYIPGELVHEEAMVPEHLSRMRRSPGLDLKIPPPPPNNQINPIGSVTHDPKTGRIASQTVGLSLDNINGHSLSATRTNIPGVGDQTAAAGTLRLINNENHKLDANAFAQHTSLYQPAAPSFNTYGGGVDYMYKDKVGVGASMARTPLFDKTDYNVGGKLNLYRSPTTSFDFNAGASRSVAPYIPHSSWEPSAVFKWTKNF